MQIDIFTQVIVPVVGGLGIFMLGLEFMSNGIQNLAVNKMRALLAKIAGTPVKGVMAGTFITGVIQSSTAMTPAFSRCCTSSPEPTRSRTSRSPAWASR
jgi:phosphate:Na+ symporter